MSRDALIILLCGVLVTLLVCCTATLGEEHEHDDDLADDEDEGKEEEETPHVNKEELEYQKGSLCGYCDYCKFCKLCDEDCPCEKGPGKPNCHMCKYCRYCYLCKVCDTVCQPGGILDRVTSKIFNSLPNFNKDEIDSDISGVKTWIDKKKDEL